MSVRTSVARRRLSRFNPNALSAISPAIVPHVSIALGPQIAAAIHFAAALENCTLCEFNPRVLEVANRFLVAPLTMEGASYVTPKGPGLGIEMLPI